MKRVLVFTLIFMLALAACAPKTEVSAGDVLKVSYGTVSKTCSVADLQALGATQVTFKDVTYVGVTLAELLRYAGIDPMGLTVVKAVASDGFTANYDSSLYTKEDTIIAYATVDGPMTADDGTIRMVLPDQEGKLNVRMLTEIIAIP